jgi:type I restriction enzyme S subunit
MNAERLLAQFERISEAPDAIARLRRFILDLAVRGKLVEQDPEDEPAAELLSLIERQKNLTRRNTSGSRAKDVSKDSSVKPPFGVPNGWEWVCLGDILLKLTDGTHHSPPNGPTGEFLYITAKNIKPGGVSLSDVTYVTKAVHAEIYSRCNPEEGDILYIKDGATTGVVAINNLVEPFSMLSSVALLKVPGCIFNGLLLQFLRSPFFYQQMRGFMKGGAIPRVTLKRMAPALLPIPPLAEQHRIVAKVNELMALCDQLEAARQQREQGRERLAAATLQRLNQPAEDPTSFRKDASFALQVLPSLTTTPAQIKQLRQTILNLAVRGKLVEQDPEDEPVLSSGIFLKLQGQSPKRSKRGRTSSTASLDMERYQQVLPAGWASLRLADLVAQDRPISYGVLVPGDDVPKGVPFVRAQDLALDGHPSQPGKSISPDVERAYSRTRLLGGEILICVVGSIGKLGIAPAEWAGANIARAVARIAPISDSMKGYLLLVLRSSLAQSFFFEATRTLAQPTLNIGLLEEIPIPLPPLAEQHRIVSRVDELMALCDQLELQLSQADQQRRRLLEAVLAEALLEPEKTLEAVYA